MMREGESVAPPPEAVERQNRERVQMWRARQRLVGGYVAGGLSVLNLGFREPAGADLVVWVSVLLLGFGLATFDGLLKAIGRK